VNWRLWLLVIPLVILILDGAFVGLLLILGKSQEARAVAGFVPDCLILFKRLLADKRVPVTGKLLLGGMVLYLAMPFDLVPDFIPVAGQLDDAILVAWVLRHVLGSAGPTLISKHWPGLQESLDVVLRMSRGSA
jgi:uncharacterized membrane protein YkvA (DUF1232 family)